MSKIDCIQIKHAKSIVCSLDVQSRVVQDMFSSWTFQGVYTEDGSELLDVSYLRKGDSIALELVDIQNIYTFMKTMDEERIYCSDPSEDEYIKELHKALKEAYNTYKDDDFSLICE